MNSISLEKVATGSVSLDWVEANKAGEIFFIEGRPHEKGRQTLLKIGTDGNITEVTPAPINVRTRVHEYGGKAYCLLSSGEIAYVDDSKGGALFVSGRQLTDGTTRFADFVEGNGNLISIAESEDKNYLASIDLKTGEITPIFNQSDFVAAPAYSKGKLLWIAWNHPNMPWDTTTLYFKEGESIKVVSENSNASILQPEFGPNGEFLYLSDIGGFWNLFEGENPLFLMQVDCAKPAWVVGNKSYAIDGDEIALAFQKDGFWRVAHRRLKTWIILPIEFADISSLRLQNGILYFAASFVDDTRKICSFNLTSWELKKLYGQPLELEKISLPEVLTFPSGGQTVVAYYYPPTVKTTGLPPLLLRAHGGPTSQTTPSFNWAIAYWTSLGFGYLDVNYRGSTGFGRRFRQSLYGNWGTFDWQDCEKAASLAIKRGLANPDAVFITGSSAGGFTVLSALTKSPVFKAGTSYYGVADLQALVDETKFESHYTERLVGSKTIPPFPYETLEKPLLFFHGKEDKVVPPNQPIKLHRLLQEKGIPTDLVFYEKEGHGFRSQETIEDTLRREYLFYSQFIPKATEV